jgi:hypothetical protein
MLKKHDFKGVSSMYVLTHSCLLYCKSFMWHYNCMSIKQYIAYCSMYLQVLLQYVREDTQ